VPANPDADGDGDGYTNGNTHEYAHGDGNTHEYADQYADGDGDGYTNGNTHEYGDQYADRDADTDGYSDGDTDQYPCSAGQLLHGHLRLRAQLHLRWWHLRLEPWAGPGCVDDGSSVHGRASRRCRSAWHPAAEAVD